MTLLLVDDDPHVRRAVTLLLRAHGHDVHVFASAEDCLATPVEADCAIVDVTLPGRGGLDLHADLVARSTPLPVVFISARTDPGILEAVRRAGQQLVRKPIDEHELIRAIAQASAG